MDEQTHRWTGWPATKTREVVLETRIPTSRLDSTEVLGDCSASCVVLEASTPSEWGVRHLESIGMEVIVADPNFAPMYATRSKKVKTDKRDARCLAQAARLGAYKPAHRMSDEQRDVRTRSYLGLVPRQNSSGESPKRGHITRAGCTQTRALLVQAAQRILRLRNPETEVLWIWAQRTAKRRGKGIVVVALARRLSGILWAMLRDKQLYQAKRRRAEGEAKTAPGRTSTGTQAQAAWRQA